MRKTKKVKALIEKTLDVTCNNCGWSCHLGNYGDTWDEKNTRVKPGKDSDEDVYGGLIEVEVHGSYMSTELTDLTSYCFSLCETCLKKMMKKFKVPVEVRNDVTNNRYVAETKYGALEKKHNKVFKIKPKKTKTLT